MIIIIYILFTILWLSKGIKKSKGIKVYYDYHSLNILWLPTGDIKSPLAMPITMVIVMRLHPTFLLVCFWFSLYWICHLCWFYKISLALMKYIYISLNHQFFYFFFANSRYSIYQLCWFNKNFTQSSNLIFIRDQRL